MGEGLWYLSYFGNLGPEVKGILAGLNIGYDNTVNNCLFYCGSGSVYQMVRTSKRAPCGYFTKYTDGVHLPEVTNPGDRTSADSAERTQQGRPWKMKISMVIAGGRMWFIIDGTLYDPNIHKMMSDQTGSILPGTVLDGSPDDLLVPLFRSGQENLIEFVHPDPTFTKIYIPGHGEVPCV